LHAHLLPHLRSWGLNVSAHPGPSGIGLDHIKKAHAVIFCGSRESWSAKDENRVTAAATCVIECDDSHPTAPRKINNRFIAVSSRSLHGIFRALQLATNSSGPLLQPPSSMAAQSWWGDGISRLQDAPAPIRNAFIESTFSSLRIIQTSTNRKAVALELHNLSGSLQFFHLVELSMQCVQLEEGIHQEGMDSHEAHLATLASSLDSLMKAIHANAAP
jgi:HPt (histidine-containing phosphotransfer) domain-containing protein